MLATAKTHAPCRVYDANGLEWKHLRWVDTETGEAEQCVLDNEGRKVVNQERTGLATTIVRMPVPVLIVPIKRDEE